MCFYVNAIVDVEDVDIDLAALAGKNSTLQLSMVGYSLYSVEIVVLYLARKYYSIMFKNGFSSLEIRLRYFVQDMKDAVSSPYADSGRISTFVDPRKLSALIQNSSKCSTALILHIQLHLYEYDVICRNQAKSK